MSFSSSNLGGWIGKRKNIRREGVGHGERRGQRHGERTIQVLTHPSNTQYNLVIGVLCMFFYLIKCTGWFLHVLWPIFSLPLHAALLALWAVSIRVQTAPDTIDPNRINNGAPWYITKSCGIASSGTIKQYCMQAKASFAVSVIMLYVYILHSSPPLSTHFPTNQIKFIISLTILLSGLYAIHMLLALFSLLRPTSTARTAHETKLATKRAEKEKWAHLAASPLDNEMTAEQRWQHAWELQQLPRTPGTAGGMRSPMTPRTQAFGALDGTSPQQGHGWYAPGQPGATGLGVSHEHGNANGYGYGHGHGEIQEENEYVPDRKTGNAY